jgi:hypothetical protein
MQAPSGRLVGGCPAASRPPTAAAAISPCSALVEGGFGGGAAAGALVVAGGPVGAADAGHALVARAVVVLSTHCDRCRRSGDWVHCWARMAAGPAGAGHTCTPRHTMGTSQPSQRHRGAAALSYLCTGYQHLWRSRLRRCSRQPGRRTAHPCSRFRSTCRQPCRRRMCRRQCRPRTRHRLAGSWQRSLRLQGRQVGSPGECNFIPVFAKMCVQRLLHAGGRKCCSPHTAASAPEHSALACLT